MSNVVSFPSQLPDDLEPDWGLIATCRECGKLLAVRGQREGEELVVMSTGAPVFGPCASQRQYPGCGEKFAANVIAGEHSIDGGRTLIWVNPTASLS